MKCRAAQILPQSCASIYCTFARSSLVNSLLKRTREYKEQWKRQAKSSENLRMPKYFGSSGLRSLSLGFAPRSESKIGILQKILNGAVGIVTNSPFFVSAAPIIQNHGLVNSSSEHIRKETITLTYNHVENVLITDLKIPLLKAQSKAKRPFLMRCITVEQPRKTKLLALDRNSVFF